MQNALMESFEARQMLSASLGLESTMLPEALGSDGLQTATVAALGSNGGVVAWSAANMTGGSGYDVAARQLDRTGRPTGPVFIVNTDTSGDDKLAATAVAPDGGFGVVWSNDGTLTFRRYAADGTAGDEVALVTTSETVAKLAFTADNGFVLAYVDSTDDAVRLQKYDADGAADGSPVDVATGATADHIGDVVIDTNGRLLVSWTHESAPGVGDTFVRAYGADLAPATAAVQLNDTGDASAAARLAMTPNGRAVAVWSARDNGHDHAYMQRLTSLGELLGNEVKLSRDLVGGDYVNPVVATSPGGLFAVQFNDSAVANNFTVLIAPDGAESGVTVTELESSHDAISAVTLSSDFQINTFQGNATHLIESFSNDVVLSITGTSGNDQITFGSDGINLTVNTSDSSDVVPLLATRTQITTLGGNDTVTLPIHLPTTLGPISILTGDGNDRVFGSDDAEFINAGGGRDSVHAGGGDDVIFGGGGSDRVWAGEGRDRVKGGGSGDILHGDGGADSLYGDGGNDRLFGDAGSNRLYGNFGDDLLVGHIRDDTLFGGEGNDVLFGGRGMDVLNGGAGDDVADTTSEDVTAVAIELTA